MLESTQAMYTRMQEELFRSEQSTALLFWVLQLMLNELRVDHRRRVELTHTIERIIRGVPDEAEAARRIAVIMRTEAIMLDDRLSRRAIHILELIRRYLQTGESVLDFGCGDGQVGLSLSTSGHKVCLYDVTNYLGTAELAIGKNGLEFTTDWAVVQSCAPRDLGLAIHVLHHCEDPDAELARLARETNRLIVMESVLDDHTMPWALQALVDWLYNRGFHPGANIPVPGNFRKVAEWRSVFWSLGLRITAEEDLGIDLPLVPEHHHLFVLERT